MIDLVIKLGHAVLSRPEMLERAARALHDVARTTRVLIVPGGGPFADAVRAVEPALRLSSSESHWLAIRAMDAAAGLLVASCSGSRLVREAPDVAHALSDGAIAVLAPYRWVRAADPFPHSWDVTSDSISAWVAGELHASRLVLVKPVEGPVERLVDPYFTRALPAGVEARVIAAASFDAARLV